MCFEVLGIDDSVISVLVAINKKTRKNFCLYRHILSLEYRNNQEGDNYQIVPKKRG